MLNGILDFFTTPANDETGPVMQDHSFSKGFNGDLNVDSAIAIEDDKIVLAVNYDFAEAPTHVEFDLNNRHIRITQMTGDVATLAQITVPMDEKDLILKSNKIVLVTGTGEDKLLQVLTLKKLGISAIAATA